MNSDIRYGYLPSTRPSLPRACHIMVSLVHSNRQPANEMEDETQLRRDIDEEVVETKETFDRENVERVAQYSASLAEWKTYQRTRVQRWHVASSSLLTLFFVHFISLMVSGHTETAPTSYCAPT